MWQVGGGSEPFRLWRPPIFLTLKLRVQLRAKPGTQTRAGALARESCDEGTGNHLTNLIGAVLETDLQRLDDLLGMLPRVAALVRQLLEAGCKMGHEDVEPPPQVQDKRIPMRSFTVEVDPETGQKKVVAWCRNPETGKAEREDTPGWRPPPGIRLPGGGTP